MTRDKRRALTTTKKYPAAKPAPGSVTQRVLGQIDKNQQDREKRASRRHA